MLITIYYIITILFKQRVVKKCC